MNLNKYSFILLTFLVQACVPNGSIKESQDFGLVTTYSFTFRNFSTREIIEITDIMESEFPGFIRASAPEGSSSSFNYGYVTKANASKLYRWINLMLIDIGLDPDEQVKMVKRGSKLELNKLFD